MHWILLFLHFLWLFPMPRDHYDVELAPKHKNNLFGGHLHNSTNHLQNLRPIKPISTALGLWRYAVQFSSVTQSCTTLYDPMDYSTPGLPVHHQLPEFTQTYVHWVGDAIQPSHLMLSPSPPTFNFSQHQGLFKWVSTLYQVAKVLEFQLQHQSFQWIFKTDYL